MVPPIMIDWTKFRLRHSRMRGNPAGLVDSKYPLNLRHIWIPAYAGMTEWGTGQFVIPVQTGIQ
jgi:hypothetical protein